MGHLMHEPSARVPASGRQAILHRKCAECGAPAATGGACVKCAAANQGDVSQGQAAIPADGRAPPSVGDVLRSPGRALNAKTQSFMESHFAHDFSNVRVHTDPQAAASAAAINASAYSVGRHIVFANGAYGPDNPAGKRLLAHELAHVVQQAGVEAPPGAPLFIADASDPSEVEAERAAQSIGTHDSFTVTERTGPRIFRQAPPGPAVPLAPPPPAVCAQPVNFTLAPGVDTGPAGFYVDITWGSSSGPVANLAHCDTREVVTYDPIPNPPFLITPPNPTILNVPATSGHGGDTHGYPSLSSSGLARPLQDGTMVSHQVYQFKCTGAGCNGAWTDFPNQHYTITREVFGQWVRPNPWRFRVTKTGTDNPYSYSREVEVPP